MNSNSEGLEAIYKGFAETIHIVNENLIYLILPMLFLLAIIRSK